MMGLSYSLYINNLETKERNSVAVNWVTKQVILCSFASKSLYFRD